MAGEPPFFSAAPCGAQSDGPQHADRALETRGTFAPVPQLICGVRFASAEALDAAYNAFAARLGRASGLDLQRARRDVEDVEDVTEAACPAQKRLLELCPFVAMLFYAEFLSSKYSTFQ